MVIITIINIRLICEVVNKLCGTRYAAQTQCLTMAGWLHGYRLPSHLVQRQFTQTSMTKCSSVILLFCCIRMQYELRIKTIFYPPKTVRFRSQPHKHQGLTKNEKKEEKNAHILTITKEWIIKFMFFDWG